MNVSLQMPAVGPSLQGGRVVRWSKAPGESFAFGDELCVVSIEQVVALRKTQTASVLTGSRRRRKKVRDELEMRHSSGLHFQLVASEPGAIGEHVVEVGGLMKVGDVLAVLESGDTDGDPVPVSDPKSLPSLRVVANPIDSLEA